MADRGVFVAAFMTVVLVAAGAFAIPEFFVYELLTASVFVVIAVVAFFGDDRFSYMLGILVPPVWFLFKLLLGELFRDLRILKTFLRGLPSGALDTPLHGFALIAAAVLMVLSARAWRKEVTDKFLGKTFVTALIIALVWVGALGAWEFHRMSSGAAAR